MRNTSRTAKKTPDLSQRAAYKLAKKLQTCRTLSLLRWRKQLMFVAVCYLGYAREAKGSKSPKPDGHVRTHGNHNQTENQGVPLAESASDSEPSTKPEEQWWMFDVFEPQHTTTYQQIPLVHLGGTPPTWCIHGVKNKFVMECHQPRSEITYTAYIVQHTIQCDERWDKTR